LNILRTLKSFSAKCDSYLESHPVDNVWVDSAKWSMIIFIVLYNLLLKLYEERRVAARKTELAPKTAELVPATV
jgi:hypothetical protein